VHDDDVRRTHERRVPPEVEQQALDAIVQACLAPELAGRLLVCRRELDVDRSRRTGREQLEVEPAHAAANLEHVGALELGAGELCHEPPG
jgi:hypothetical protein